MHFQVRTDNHIKNSEELTDAIRAEVEGALASRFAGRLRRVEVYLQDLNSHKGGEDIRCAIEATLAGHQPVAVDHRAASLDEAVSNAINKLVRALDKTIGRLEDGNDRISMSGEPT